MRGCSSLVMLGLLAAWPCYAAELRVSVDGVRSDKGEILIGLFDHVDGFEHAIANATKDGLAADPGRLVGISIRAKAGVQSAAFPQLAPGRYALVVVHDENDNGRLDTNALGVPTEGYGFSNNAQGLLGAPSFDAAAVTVGEEDVGVTISLIYPKAETKQERKDYDRILRKGAGR
jgi:uncharacterized protein (DUF2141 family)